MQGEQEGPSGVTTDPPATWPPPALEATSLKQEVLSRLCADVMPGMAAPHSQEMGCWCACLLGWGLPQGISILAMKSPSFLGGPGHSQKVLCDFRPWECMCFSTWPRPTQRHFQTT